MKRKKTVINWSLLAGLLVLAFFFGKVEYEIGTYRIPFVMFRVGIHMGVLLAWLVSVRRRIVHPQIYRYITAVGALMLFWNLVKYIKWEGDLPEIWNSYLWYSYYLPIIFIPFFVLLISITMGKSENYRVPSCFRLIFGLGLGFFFLILTNEFHQLAFRFIIDRSGDNGTYRQGPVYYLVLLWCLFCVLWSIGELLGKCRVLKKGHRNVLLALCLAFVGYGVLYLLVPGGILIKTILNDMTVVYCLMLVSMLELCLKFRLLPNNSDYEALLRIGSLRVEIRDGAGELLIRSADFLPVSDALMQEAGTAPVSIGKELRLSSAKLSDGSVFWEDDISELMQVIEELSEVYSELQEENELVKREYIQKKKQAQLQELRRIYERIQRETSEQILYLSRRLEDYERAASEQEQKRILHQMVTIGAYLKRRNNLILLSENIEELPPVELELCFRESFSALESFGVFTDIQIAVSAPIRLSDVVRLYDFLEKVIEEAIPSLSAITVRVEPAEQGLFMIVNTDSTGDLSSMASWKMGKAEAERDEDEWHLTLLLTGGE